MFDVNQKKVKKFKILFLRLNSSLKSHLAEYSKCAYAACGENIVNDQLHHARIIGDCFLRFFRFTNFKARKIWISTIKIDTETKMQILDFLFRNICSKLLFLALKQGLARLIIVSLFGNKYSILFFSQFVVQKQGLKIYKISPK